MKYFHDLEVYLSLIVTHFLFCIGFLGDEYNIYYMSAGIFFFSSYPNAKRSPLLRLIHCASAPSLLFWSSVSGQTVTGGLAMARVG